MFNSAPCGHATHMITSTSTMFFLSVILWSATFHTKEKKLFFKNVFEALRQINDIPICLISNLYQVATAAKRRKRTAQVNDVDILTISCHMPAYFYPCGLTNLIMCGYFLTRVTILSLTCTTTVQLVPIIMPMLTKTCKVSLLCTRKAFVDDAAGWKLSSRQPPTLCMDGRLPGDTQTHTLSPELNIKHSTDPLIDFVTFKTDVNVFFYQWFFRIVCIGFIF